MTLGACECVHKMSWSNKGSSFVRNLKGHNQHTDARTGIKLQGN